LALVLEGVGETQSAGGGSVDELEVAAAAAEGLATVSVCSGEAGLGRVMDDSKEKDRTASSLTSLAACFRL
jgi:hypothetical protein